MGVRTDVGEAPGSLASRQRWRRKENVMTTTSLTRQLDMEAVEGFLGRVITDAAAAVSVLLTHLGDGLGLYRAMADVAR